MKALLQRVKSASVTVNGKKVSQIGQGLLILFGVEKGDSQAQADFLAKKSTNLRIFEDENGKMNLSIKDIKGEALIVSQFTLAGDTSRGNRPGFDTAADPKSAEQLYRYFSDTVRSYGVPVQNGIFQADMQVELINDGPVTFMLEK
jgi:D-tyrosyl-tRNA(Tyr) deacylase